MGCICPIERKGAPDQIEEKEALVGADRVDTSSSKHRKNTKEPSKDKEKANVQLRTDETITRLVGAFRLYYRAISQIQSSKGYEIFTAEYLSTKQRCVIRKITKNFGAKDRKSLRERLAIEAENVMKLDHPYVLRTLELLQDTEKIYIVSEIYKGRELLDFVNNGGLLTEHQVAIFMYQLLSALNYSHQQSITYRHLSLRSIVFLEEIRDSTLTAKLVPYESFEALIKGKDNRCKVASDFRAPEVDLEEGTEKSDVWSCGMILSYALTGDGPFDKVQQVIKDQVKDKYVANFSSPAWRERSRDLIEMVRAMVARDPDKRPSISDCINNPWIQSLSGDISVTSKPVRTSLANLRSSQVCTTLKEAVMRFIVSRVVKEKEINELSESFLALDINKDGVISYDELLDGYRKIMPDAKAKEEADKVMRAADKDGNGEIDYSEFLLSSFSKDRLLSRENLRTAFQSLDEDGSGQISLAELKRTFAIKGSEEGEAQWQRLIQEADSSGDGEIDFYEFTNLMTLQLNRG